MRISNHPRYMPEIDGLRAIAVLAVVAFHAFPEWAHGGFIGVDIFFVISGYLISTIIFRSLEQGNFSFGDFYARRVLRIFPALLLMFAGCYVFGWFSLFSDEFSQLGKHIATGAGFLLNFVLRRESGYFDNSADTKPLLHLWSLSIEEQFYIFWPLLLYMAWKHRWNFLSITLAIAFGSFALNIYFTLTHQNIMDFYSPFSRFWELMVGGILAYLLLHKPGMLPRYYNMQALAGVALIAAAIWLLNKTSSFPSWHALLPTLGAFLIIAAGQQAWFNRHILSNPLMVGVGLISYPLYLWHWPLLSFARILEGGKPELSWRAGAVVIAMLLAWLTYQFVEKPMRLGRGAFDKTVILIMLMLVMGSMGYYTHRHDGFESRSAMKSFALNDPELHWHNERSAECRKLIGTDAAFCLLFGNQNHITTAVIGDSTANALAPGLAGIYANEQDGLINIGQGACAPIRMGEVPVTQEENCRASTEKAYHFILATESIHTVMLGFMATGLHEWVVPGADANASAAIKFEKLKPYLARDIAELLEHGKRVIVTYDMPSSPVSARDCVERPVSIGTKMRCAIHEADLENRQPYLSYFDNYFSGNDDVCVFRQSQLLIPHDQLLLFDTDGKLFLRDNFHLSMHGSQAMAQMFKQSSCMQEN